MIKQVSFNWVLEDTSQTRELQSGLSQNEFAGNRQVFFAQVEEEKNLGYEVIDSFVCFSLKYERKVSPWFWTKVKHTDAPQYLVNIIGTDMAYDTISIDPEESDSLAKRFLALFAVPLDHISFYSNFGWDSDRGVANSSGFGVTGATFDRLVIGLTRNRIGFILAEDED